MSFDDYLFDIGKIPLLTSEEEIVLGNKVQEMMRLLEAKGVSERISASNLEDITESMSASEKKIVKVGIRARNKLVSSNMRLVVAIAKKFFARQVHMTMQDLVQEGAIGLTRAAEKFDPSRGYKFSTYAYLWIKQGITRGCESQEGAIKLPAHVQRAIKKAIDTREILSVKLGREPSFNEISEAMNEKDPAKVREMLMTSPIVLSLDRCDGDGNHSFLESASCAIVENESEDRERDGDNMRLDYAMMAIGALEESDQELILHKYGLTENPLSVKEIAKNHGVAPQAIRERQQRITKRIRYILASFAMPAS